MLLHYTLKILM